MCVQYAIIVTIVIVLEIVAAIVVFVFRNDLVSYCHYWKKKPVLVTLSRTQLDRVETNSITAITLYRVDEDASDFNAGANAAVNAFQDLVSAPSQIPCVLWCMLIIMMQFECCGFNNASDWSVYNPEAVLDNNGPPSCPTCTPGEADCMQYSATVGQQTVTFYTTDVVRGRRQHIHLRCTKLAVIGCLVTD